ncbi:hypothetical protein XM48_06815 [Leucobacter sp. Ag1]|nr:hypothetical protein XM48_06815 [Leucobacter sp. Ag1]
MARYAPGPRLISRISRRAGLKWGVPSMLVAVPYFLVANMLKSFIDDDGVVWLSLPLLWCLAMGIAFIVLGPVSLLLLIGHWVHDRVKPQVWRSGEFAAGLS